MKDDIAEFRAVCAHCNLTPDEQRRFGRWLHQYKKRGGLGTKNAKGDFTWDEFVAVCGEFKQEQGIP